jgi:hypothetical protein
VFAALAESWETNNKSPVWGLLRNNQFSVKLGMV